MSDEDEDDRPRRRYRDDDEDDRPRRARRSGNSGPPPAVTVLGVLSVVIGALSLLGSFIPFIGMFAIVTAVISLVMGVIGIAIAKQANSGMGLPGTGTVLSVLAIVIAIAWFVIISVFMKGFMKVGGEDAGEKLRDENRQNAQQQKNESPGSPVFRSRRSNCTRRTTPTASAPTRSTSVRLWRSPARSFASTTVRSRWWSNSLATKTIARIRSSASSRLKVARCWPPSSQTNR